MNKRCLFRFLTLLTTLTLLFISGVSKSSAFSVRDNLKQIPYEKLNLLILVKASESSNHRLSDLSYSKSRLEIIQESIPLVLEQYPLPPNVNIGIMAYGHLIDKTDISLSCSSDNVGLVVPMQPASPIPDLENFRAITGRGEVPAAVALEEAGKVFTQTSPEVLNVILLIADRSDTCAQNPLIKAKELAERKSIVVYTIGFMADTKASKELEDIANQTSGKYLFISPYIGDNDLAIAELSSTLFSVFDDLLTQISIPTQTNTPTQTAVASLAPTSTNTPIPVSTPTGVLPKPTLGPISTVPVPAEKSPSLPFGIFIVVAIFFLGVLGFGFWLWKLRTPLKPIDKPVEPERTTTPDEGLEQFKKDLFKAYFSIEAKKHYPKFIPLEAVKEELSNKYTQEQFNDLLGQARRKYPDNIWIDKDKEQPQVFIKIVRK